MPVGSIVRRAFGRHERLVSDMWRRAFIDLDAFVAQVGEWASAPRHILEIGCGEGAGTERLAARFPASDILAIDIASNLGRLYRGREDGVQFRQITVQDLADECEEGFDLIVMCDVLHHIPRDLREDVLSATRRLLSPDGRFVMKDWERRPTPIHWITYGADRWLTGDRISYPTRVEAEELLADGFGAARARATVGPWRNNFALLLQPST